MDTRHHRLQQSKDSCVSACCRILRSMRNEPDFDELRFHQQIQVLGRVSLSSAADHFKWYCQTWDFWTGQASIKNLSILKSFLAGGEPIIATVGGKPLAWLNEQRGLKDRSPHGPLASPDKNDMSEPHHAIVLIGVDGNDHIFYLDPWLPRDTQPRSLALDDFVHMAHGDICIPGYE